jgi:hypothetical protein
MERLLDLLNAERSGMEIGAIMRVLLTVGFLAALLASWGCRPDEHAADGNASGADLWFRYHFIGTRAATQAEHGTQLKHVASFDQTIGLVRYVLDRLARSPAVLAGNALTVDQVDQGAVILRPMLDDLLFFESFLEVRGPAAHRPEWLLGVALPPERGAAWHTGLKRLSAVWGLGEVNEAKATGDTGIEEIYGERSPGKLNWVELGGWLLVGMGGDQSPLFDQALRDLQDQRSPVASQKEDWLTVEVDLQRVAGPLQFPRGTLWPLAELSVAGRDENLRSTIRLLFPEPVTGALLPWQVPTNIACEPLVSFTALRGVAPLLKRLEGLQLLEVEPVPNELYFWAQEHTAFTTFGAFPTAAPTNQIKRIAEQAPRLLGERWQQQGLAQVEWDEVNHRAIWKGLLMVTPHLRPVQDAGTNFIVGGLFPQLRTSRPPPPELLAQFVSRPDVVYYDWEITQVRLSQWRHLSQLFAVIAGEPQLSTNMVALNWLLLMETEPLLGNTITEITAVSPKEWLLVRRSHIGLNGLELVALARWIESRDFPRLTLRLPDDGSRKLRHRPPIPRP